MLEFMSKQKQEFRAIPAIKLMLVIIKLIATVTSLSCSLGVEIVTRVHEWTLSYSQANGEIEPNRSNLEFCQ